MKLFKRTGKGKNNNNNNNNNNSSSSNNNNNNSSNNNNTTTNNNTNNNKRNTQPVTASGKNQQRASASNNKQQQAPPPGNPYRSSPPPPPGSIRKQEVANKSNVNNINSNNAGLRISTVGAVSPVSESPEATSSLAAVAAAESGGTTRPSNNSGVQASLLPGQPQLQQPGVPTAGPALTPPQSLPSSATAQQMQESQQATVDLTRNLVKKFIADIWNRGEIDLIPEVCSPSLRFNGNTGFDRVGHDGLARMVATIRDALDDYHCEIHSMVVEHNKAFCRLRFTGKHTGNLLGYPPTGRVVGWMGATEFTCQNGKILKVWELGDIKTLEEQLIAMDDPAAAGGGPPPPQQFQGRTTDDD